MASAGRSRVNCARRHRFRRLRSGSQGRRHSLVPRLRHSGAPARTVVRRGLCQPRRLPMARRRHSRDTNSAADLRGYYRKSVDQLLALLQVLHCDVDLVVRTKTAGRGHARKRARSPGERRKIKPSNSRVLRGTQRCRRPLHNGRISAATAPVGHSEVLGVACWRLVSEFTGNRVFSYRTSQA